MNEEMFRAEKLYQTTMAVAKTMLSKELITPKEYEIIDSKMLEKYRPLLGSLLANTSLTL